MCAFSFWRTPAGSSMAIKTRHDSSSPSRRGLIYGQESVEVEVSTN